MVCTIAGKQWPQEPLCVGDHQSFPRRGLRVKGLKPLVRHAQGKGLPLTLTKVQAC